MSFSRATLLLCLVFSCTVGTWAATTTIKTPVLMFDDKDLSGGSQNFPVVLPAFTVANQGCADCENLNFLRTNSWESYVAANGTTIELFDGHGCTGKTSGKIAPWGVIPGTLKDSVDSFILCYNPTGVKPVINNI